jgi:hypothetical protein
MLKSDHWLDLLMIVTNIIRTVIVSPHQQLNRVFSLTKQGSSSLKSSNIVVINVQDCNLSAKVKRTYKCTEAYCSIR